MELNLLMSDKYIDREICKQCKHYREEKVRGELTQVVDSFCCKCYSDKVYIITRFEKTDRKK